MPVSRLYAALLVRARIVTLLAGLLATPVLTREAGAVTKLWTGGTSSDWSVAGNWSPAGAPASGDSVQFPLAGANRTVNLAGDRTVADVAFTGSNSYRLTNNQLTIASGDITSSLANHRIDSSVVLGGEAAWNIASGRLSVYGSVNSTTGNTSGIDKTGAGTLEFLNTGTTNILKNYLHQAGTAEFFEGTYTLTSSTFDAFSAMYMAEGTVTVSHRAKLHGTSAGNLVLQSSGAGSSNLIIRDEQTEVATFGQLFLGASGTSGNSLTVAKNAKVRDIGLFIAGFNGNAAVTVASEATVSSNAMAVGMLPGVTSTLTVEDPMSALTTNFLALGGYNSAQKGGTGTATISDRASLAVSGELRFFSSTSSLTIDSATATIGSLTNEPGVVGSIKLRNDGGTPALTITSPVTQAAPGPFTFDGVISNATNGSGGIVKQGPGTQIFTRQQTYTGGTRIEAGTLQLGTANTLAPTGLVTATGGTLDLGGHQQRTGPFTLSGGTVSGVAGSLLMPVNLTVQSGTIDVPVIATGGLNKTAAGTATLNYGVTTPILSLNQGTLQLKGAVSGAVQGGPSGTLTLVGPTTVADITTLAGSLNVGSHTLSTPKTVSTQTLSLAGGSIVADMGFTLAGAATGHGAIFSPITGYADSSITAAGGSLTLGAPGSTSGFTNFQGTLSTGAQQVNLLSGGIAKLGATTTLAGGSLSSLYGIQLDAGRTVSGHGAVNGAFVNQGAVNGAAGLNPIIFTGSVSGAGSYSGNIQFNGAFSPGNSPAAVSFAGDATLANTALLVMEVGGDDQGTEYDHLDVTGKLTLGGSMAVQFITGFTPTSPLSFNLFDWGTIEGGFNAINLPSVNGFAWNASQLLIDGTLSLTPLYAADFDSNGRVDAADLTILRSGFGNTMAGRATGDATGDGVVTGADFLVWQRQLGSGVAATTAGVTIPEPASVLLALSAMLILHNRKRVQWR
jgi:autotransporter-associated beta strand protein